MGVNEILKQYGNKLSEFKVSDELIERGKMLAEKFLPVIRHITFDDFKENVENNRFEDAYSSDVFKTIRGLCSENNTRILKQGTKVYRARIIDINDLYTASKGLDFNNGVLIGYDWLNSKEPPIGLSPDGRANSKYSSYFYCSNNPNTAACEVKPNITDYISLASFEIKKDLKLIELTESPTNDDNSDDVEFRNMISRYFSVPIKDSQNYKLTQFISDEIRKSGIDGLCYKSYFTGAMNYVIFNCCMSNIEFSKSKVLKLHSQKLFFIDFSNEKVLQTTCETDVEPEKILSEKCYLFEIIESAHNRNILEEDEDNG